MFYQLTNWVKENGTERQLNNGERRRLKGILASVGISSIKFIGIDNYIEMFKDDTRFAPRIEQHFLFNEFDDLPSTLEASALKQTLFPHISVAEKGKFLTVYHWDRARNLYRLTKDVSIERSEELKTILAEKMYQKVVIPGVIGFTLFFMFFNVIFSNFFALVLALILDSKLRTRNVLRSIFFLPNVLSLVIVAFIWSFVFRLILPVVTGIPLWLGSPELAPYCVVAVSVWQGCGYLMIIYLAGLQTIPVEILESAEIDGASWRQRFQHISWPLLTPALTICLFYSISNSLKTFEVPMALTNGGPGYVTTPVVYDVYLNAFMQNRYGYGTAKAVLLCLIIMLVTGIQLTIMKKREVEL
jgi:raffinose/stachyose/melibiose transport system permease protein